LTVGRTYRGDALGCGQGGRRRWIAPYQSSSILGRIVRERHKAAKTLEISSLVGRVVVVKVAPVVAVLVIPALHHTPSIVSGRK
jgi:hypothetical protein